MLDALSRLDAERVCAWLQPALQPGGPGPEVPTQVRCQRGRTPFIACIPSVHTYMQYASPRLPRPAPPRTYTHPPMNTHPSCFRVLQ